MSTIVCCQDAKAAGAALIRWGLGLLLLTSGIGKIGNIPGFVNGYLLKTFESTVLPPWLVGPYGYALPVVEVALGILLLLGIYRTLTLLVTGLTFLSLAFGQMLLKQHEKVSDILIYLTMTGLCLWFADRDRWIIRLGRKAADRTPSDS